MARNERMELIREIENLTGSKVLVYVTGDRRGLETKISSDVTPLIFKHLNKLGARQKITLFVYTTGGITVSGYSIVNLIREYCEKFQVAVPFRCLSTGTLMALGADSIIMSKMGQLGPVDPSVEHALGPKVQHPHNSQQQMVVPVNVEDVVSVFDLAKREAKIESEGELSNVLSTLASGIHPLVLGAVNRTRNEIRFLAKTMLEHHMDDTEKIDSIVRTLIEERFSHNYIIGRKEAKNVLGLNIVDVSDELNNAIIRLYHEYVELLKLNCPLVVESELGDQDEVTRSFDMGIVETNEFTHTYRRVLNIKRVQVTGPGTNLTATRYQDLLKSEGWIEDNSI